MKKKYFIYISIGLLLLTTLIIYKIIIKKNSFYVNVSNIDLKVEVERFDLDFEKFLVPNSYSNIAYIEDNYGEFFNIYNTEIIGIGSSDNSSYLTFVSTFLNDFAVSQARKQVNKEFSKLNDVNEDLTCGFKHLKYYFPQTKIPRILSFIAGFNHSVVILDDFIGIGLDKYLGNDCELYSMLNIPDFSKLEMTRNQIAIDVLAAWAEAEFVFVGQSDNLLENMIYNGRELYFLYCMFPDFSRARINKYTEEQLQFCNNYEREMWTSIVENKLLFSTDALTIKRFVGAAPFTYQFGPNSPPRTGNWLGLQIVISFMNTNKISLDELMKETDYQKILNLSNYNPKYK